MPDTITIANLEVHARVGVPEEERAQPQRLLLNIEMEKPFSAAAANDDIAATIDYHAVATAVAALCETGERQLIETLAEEIAALILRDFQPDCVRVEIRKFILPNTSHVGVSVERRG